VGLRRKGIRDFEVLGQEMGRTPRAIEMKLKQRGVVVMKQKFDAPPQLQYKVGSVHA